MSPQILTETLYAITIDKKETPFIPTEIHLISTSEGARRAILQLLNAKDEQFHQLCQDYELTNIEFSEQNVYAITNKNGNELSDIKTPEDNEAAALHVSIAGGRKTMGYYLGYALSLYGRPQDRLSHVLVSENYEGLRDFFYPTRESNLIYKGENPLDTSKAKIMLAEIPFVRLRAGLPEHLLNGKAGFSETIALARSFDVTPQLTIDLRNRCFYANSVQIKMTSVNFAFYLWMIEKTVKQSKPLKRPVTKTDYNESNHQKIF